MTINWKSLQNSSASSVKKNKSNGSCCLNSLWCGMKQAGCTQTLKPASNFIWKEIENWANMKCCACSQISAGRNKVNHQMNDGQSYRPSCNKMESSFNTRRKWHNSSTIQALAPISAKAWSNAVKQVRTIINHSESNQMGLMPKSNSGNEPQRWEAGPMKCFPSLPVGKKGGAGHAGIPRNTEKGWMVAGALLVGCFFFLFYPLPLTPYCLATLNSAPSVSWEAVECVCVCAGVWVCV